MILVAFCFSTMASPWVEASFWEERRQFINNKYADSEKNVFARRPQSLSHINPIQIINQLPSFKSRPIAHALSENIKKDLPDGFSEKYSEIFRSLSHEYGSIRKISVPEDKVFDHMIVHIQDVHQNYEAQRNIANTVQKLVDSKKIGLVALEGAFEPFDLKRFREFPRKEPLRMAADSLLEENEISGPIHTALISSESIPPFVGIDHPEQYNQNVKAYRESVSLQGNYKNQTAVLQRKIDSEKKKTFNRDLVVFDEKVEAYRSRKTSLGDFIESLSSRSVKMSGNIKTFLAALELEEKLDFSVVEKQRTKIIEEYVHQASFDEIKTLMEYSVGYRLGKINYAAFYRKLEKLCRENKINLAEYPAMQEFIKYVFLSDEINAAELFDELRHMEKQEYDRLAKTEQERKLIRQSKHIYLTGKLLNFSLTPHEWEEYKKIKDEDIGLDGIADVSSFEAFFQQAEMRNQSITKNLFNSMNKYKTDVAVLVTGGFHSDGIERMLKDKGVACITFTPKIAKVETGKGSSYLSVFAREKLPVEQLFEGEELFVAKNPCAETSKFLLAVRTALASPKNAVYEFHLLADKAIRTRILQAETYFSNRIEYLKIRLENSEFLASFNQSNGFSEKYVKPVKSWLSQFFVQDVIGLVKKAGIVYAFLGSAVAITLSSFMPGFQFLTTVTIMVLAGIPFLAFSFGLLHELIHKKYPDTIIAAPLMNIGLSMVLASATVIAHQSGWSQQVVVLLGLMSLVNGLLGTIHSIEDWEDATGYSFDHVSWLKEIVPQLSHRSDNPGEEKVVTELQVKRDIQKEVPKTAILTNPEVEKKLRRVLNTSSKGLSSLVAKKHKSYSSHLDYEEGQFLRTNSMAIIDIIHQLILEWIYLTPEARKAFRQKAVSILDEVTFRYMEINEWLEFGYVVVGAPQKALKIPVNRLRELKPYVVGNVDIGLGVFGIKNEPFIPKKAVHPFTSIVDKLMKMRLGGDLILENIFQVLGEIPDASRYGEGRDQNGYRVMKALTASGGFDVEVYELIVKAMGYVLIIKSQSIGHENREKALSFLRKHAKLGKGSSEVQVAASYSLALANAQDCQDFIKPWIELMIGNSVIRTPSIGWANSFQEAMGQVSRSLSDGEFDTFFQMSDAGLRMPYFFYRLGNMLDDEYVDMKRIAFLRRLSQGTKEALGDSFSHGANIASHVLYKRMLDGSAAHRLPVNEASLGLVKKSGEHSVQFGPLTGSGDQDRAESMQKTRLPPGRMSQVLAKRKTFTHSTTMDQMFLGMGNDLMVFARAIESMRDQAWAGELDGIKQNLVSVQETVNALKRQIKDEKSYVKMRSFLINDCGLKEFNDWLHWSESGDDVLLLHSLKKTKYPEAVRVLLEVVERTSGLMESGPTPADVYAEYKRLVIKRHLVAMQRARENPLGEGMIDEITQKHLPGAVSWLGTKWGLFLYKGLWGPNIEDIFGKKGFGYTFFPVIVGYLVGLTGWLDPSAVMGGMLLFLMAFRVLFYRAHSAHRQGPVLIFITLAPVLVVNALFSFTLASALLSIFVSIALTHSFPNLIVHFSLSKEEKLAERFEAALYAYHQGKTVKKADMDLVGLIDKILPKTGSLGVEGRDLLKASYSGNTKLKLEDSFDVELFKAACEKNRKALFGNTVTTEEQFSGLVNGVLRANTPSIFLKTALRQTEDVEGLKGKIVVLDEIPDKKMGDYVKAIIETAGKKTKIVWTAISEELQSKLEKAIKPYGHENVLLVQDAVSLIQGIKMIHLQLDKMAKHMDEALFEEIETWSFVGSENMIMEAGDLPRNHPFRRAVFILVDRLLRARVYVLETLKSWRKMAEFLAHFA